MNCPKCNDTSIQFMETVWIARDVKSSDDEEIRIESDWKMPDSEGDQAEFSCKRCAHTWTLDSCLNNRELIFD